MTWHHAFVIAFALGVVAYCGRVPTCHDIAPQLATLAATAIGVAGGNAMAAIQRGRQRKKAKRRRSHVK